MSDTDQTRTDHSVHTEARPDFPELMPLPASIWNKVGAFVHANNWMGLALHFPLRFEDKSTIAAMDSLSVGQKVNLHLTVTAQEVVRGRRKQLKVWAEDGDSQILLRWLHFYPGQADKMPVGSRLKVSGQIRQGYGTLEIVHPTVSRLSPAEESLVQKTQPSTSGTLEPVYPSGGNLKQSDWQRWIKQIPAACMIDTIPSASLKKHRLLPWDETLRTLHGQAQPENLNALNSRFHPAWDRVKLDELLAQQLLLRQFRIEKQKEKAPGINSVNRNFRQQFLSQLDFDLTHAQKNALEEILTDMARPFPMQRLLQGDVGSGKTVVAALACLQTIEAGFQAAFLAPTEVLAEQHYFKLNQLFARIGVTCARLQGSMKSKEKKTVLEQLKNGQSSIVIGTHALFQNTVEFQNLALVIVDEQHRFGVEQRLSLISKANNNQLAHQLMMSATPIPRTLAQTYLSDLSVSNLDEKPSGRQPILTKLVSQDKRDQLMSAIETELNKKQQVYWVCPLIEESEKLDLQAAQATAQELATALPHRKVALLHGKQDATTKQTTMQAFAAGEIEVLVSTTVIEVGVDVSNASLMVIDQAERFGLAQLHQLRGRVGRGSIQSVCVLLYGKPLSQTAKTRLKAMHESDDGFYLAEIDLEIRGPGELLGKRQSGLPMLRYSDPLIDKQWVELARLIAQDMPLDSPDTQRHIHRWLESTPWWLS